jgi:hypothetical protein
MPENILFDNIERKYNQSILGRFVTTNLLLSPKQNVFVV